MKSGLCSKSDYNGEYRNFPLKFKLWVIFENPCKYYSVPMTLTKHLNKLPTQFFLSVHNVAFIKAVHSFKAFRFIFERVLLAKKSVDLAFEICGRCTKIDHKNIFNNAIFAVVRFFWL